MTRNQIIEHLCANYGPDETLAVSIWSEEDVQGLEESEEWEFTPAQRAEILERFKNTEDCSVGLNWSVLEGVCRKFVREHLTSPD